jgi:TetR/AcrR family transcriptional regulator, regulator of cefoperazone and chloramphenicol sensitivity
MMQTIALPFQEQSRTRLLQAAVEVFAEKGFQSATVREICSRADANIAAVNYYFRNKEGLYVEALAFAFQHAEQRYPMTVARNRELPAQLRLKKFISVFLHRILDDSSLGHHGKLIAREIADPTNALDSIVETVIEPVFTLLAEIIQQLTGTKMNDEQTQRCVLSILGQCLMFKHSRSVIDRICPELIASGEDIEYSAEHIARFSLLALDRISDKSQEQDL